MTNYKFKQYKLVKIIETEQKGRKGYISKNYTNGSGNYVIVVVYNPISTCFYEKHLLENQIEYHYDSEIFNDIQKCIERKIMSVEYEIKNKPENKIELEQKFNNLKEDLRLIIETNSQ